jgi:RNA polymerase sigma-70 factor (ECF subfamily)
VVIAMDDMPSNSAEARGLLEQLLAGNRQAFGPLFAHYRTYLRDVVELRLDQHLRSRVDASDVVQEAQLDALGRLDDYLERRPMPFPLWLRKTAHERLLKIRRQHVETARRDMAREIPLPDRSSLQLAQQLLAGGSTPSQKVARHELACRVRQAVAELPDDDREVLLMRSTEGLSYDDVGRILEIEPTTARKRHGRALMRLHKALLRSGLTESQL